MCKQMERPKGNVTVTWNLNFDVEKRISDIQDYCSSKGAAVLCLLLAFLLCLSLGQTAFKPKP